MRSTWHSDVPPFKVISNSDVDTLPKFSFRRDTDEKIEPCYSKAKKPYKEICGHKLHLSLVPL